MRLSTGFTTQDVSGMIVVRRTFGPLTRTRVVAILTTLVVWGVDSVTHVAALVLLTGVTHVGVLVGAVSLLGGAPAV